MPQAGINLKFGSLLFILVFAASTALLYGAAQLVDREEVASAGDEAGDGGSTPGGPAALRITAQNLVFDRRTLNASPGAQVTLTFANQDAGVPHNVAFYNNSSAAQRIFVSPLSTGPVTEEYRFTAPSAPGNYFFRCDVHPDTMTGTFAVR